MIYGRAPVRSTLTPQELDTFIGTRPTPLGEYVGTNVVDAFNSSIPGAMVNEIGLPDDDLTGRLSPQLLREWKVKNGGRGPVTKEDYLSVMEKSQEHVMNHDEWLNSPYYRKEIPYDNRMTKARAEFKSEAYDAQQYRNFLRQNREMGVSTVAGAILGSVIGTLPDPTNYIPIFGEAFKVAAATRVANVARRAGIGALDAAITTAATEPVVAQSRQQFGDDITWADAFLDISVGALAGGVLGAAGGWRERIGSYDTKTAQSAIQAVSEAADSIHIDSPINVSHMASMVQERLMSSTSLATPSPRIPSGELAPAKMVVTSVPNATIPLTDNIGRPIEYETRSQADKAMKAKKAVGEKVEVQPTASGRFTLVEAAKMVFYDSYATIEAATAALKRIQPEERRAGLDIVPTEVTGRRMYAITEGLTERQKQAARSNPNILNSVIEASYPQAEKAAPSPFDKAFDQANPTMPVPARKLIWSTENKPVDVTPQEKKIADNAVGKPAKKIDDIAKEMGVDLATGTFDELENVEHLAKADMIGKDHKAALVAADELIKKADDYAKAIEQAAFCIGRRS